MSCVNNDKPKFFINRLPQNKSSLSHIVEPPPAFDFSHSKCTFKSRFGISDTLGEPVRRYDRRLFVKVDDSRSPNEWEQYAIRNGFTDNKFLPGILRVSDYVIGVDTMTWLTPKPTSNGDKHKPVHEEAQSPDPIVGSTEPLTAMNKKDDWLASSNTPPPNSTEKTVHQEDETAEVNKSWYVPSTQKSVVQHVEPTEKNADDKQIESNTGITDEELDALFFKYLFLEFKRLDARRQQAFKQSVIMALYAAD